MTEEQKYAHFHDDTFSNSASLKSYLAIWVQLWIIPELIMSHVFIDMLWVYMQTFLLVFVDLIVFHNIYGQWSEDTPCLQFEEVFPLLSYTVLQEIVSYLF